MTVCPKRTTTALEVVPDDHVRLLRRVSTEDKQDPESSRSWQLIRSRALIDSRGGVIVAEFFDVDKWRSIRWQRRPQETALLAELKNPARDFDAVVIGEPHRAF